MARLPTHLQIETRHVLTALLGGAASCEKILATILVDALADAGVLPASDMPIAPTRRPDMVEIDPEPKGGTPVRGKWTGPGAGDGGTGAAPPQPAETISSSLPSDEGAKINTAPQAPGEPAAERTGRPKADTGAAARCVLLKGKPVDAGVFRRLWFADPGLSSIAARLGCSQPTVLRIAQDFGLPARRSAEWDRARAPIAEPPPAAPDRSGEAAKNGPAPATSSPAGATRKRCAFLIDAGRNGTTRCLDEPVAGKVYCDRHLAETRAARGEA